MNSPAGDAAPSEPNERQTSEMISGSETQITWETIDISDLGKGLYSQTISVDPTADAFIGDGGDIEEAGENWNRRGAMNEVGTRIEVADSALRRQKR